MAVVMFAKPVTCDPTKLGVLAWMTILPLGIVPSSVDFLDHHRDVVADDFGQAGGVDRHDFRVVNREDVGQRLVQVGQPPNTDAPSVKELVVAMTGSLKWRVRWLRW
jgi:hypothetical protein